MPDADSKGRPIIRYSARPIEEYGTGEAIDVHKDRRVDRPEVWNLAYLSFPYETQPQAPDPYFLTHVRRTCMLNVNTLLVDLTFSGYEGPDLLASRLRMPAPWFVNWLRKNPKVLGATQLFKMYGPNWFHTIAARSRICHTYEEEPDAPVGDMSEARGLLLKFQRR